MKESRQNEILQLTKKLDITPAMRKDAEGKYQAIATYLQSQGVECNIYPQGSFALGTVVRPLSKDAFDLDTICELSVDKGSTTAHETKESVGKVLLDSERYGDVIEYDTCWTKKYANECFLSNRHANQPPAVSCHKIHVLFCCKLSRAYQIALIFSIFIVRNNNYFSISKIFERKFYFFIVLHF